MSAIFLLLAMATTVLAAEGGDKAAGMWIFVAVVIATGGAIGAAAVGNGLAMGRAICEALQGTARNPEAGGRIMTTMIIGLALIVSLCIYALVISLIMVFKIPSFEAVMKSLGG